MVTLKLLAQRDTKNVWPSAALELNSIDLMRTRTMPRQTNSSWHSEDKHYAELSVLRSGR